MELFSDTAPYTPSIIHFHLLPDPHFAIQAPEFQLYYLLLAQCVNWRLTLERPTLIMALLLNCFLRKILSWQDV